MFQIWFSVVAVGRLNLMLVAPIWPKAEVHPDFMQEGSSFAEAEVLKPKTLK